MKKTIFNIIKGYYFSIILIFFSLFSCKEPYHPTVVAQDHYLVVEGFINAGNEPTTITLTRTRNLSDTGVIISANGITDTLFELHARVSVEDDAGNSYTLPELGKGQYGGSVLPVDPQRRYRLHIVTTDNREYASAYVPVLPAPVIDSVYWRLEDDGVHIYLDAHNTNDTACYYYWSYDDAWEFHTWYHSEYKYREEDTSFIPRPPKEYLDTCWQTTVPTDILLANTTGLSENKLTGALVKAIPLHSESLSVLYSLKVELYGLSGEEYNFRQLMKKNSEDLGSIFSPQPSSVIGNIRCLTRPAEPVIGYIGAGMPAEERVWIANDQLPKSWNGDGNFYACDLKKIFNDGAGRDTLARDLKGTNPVYIPVTVEKDLQGNIQRYVITRRRCADCTQRGVRKKPDFWP